MKVFGLDCLRTKALKCLAVRTLQKVKYIMLVNIISLSHNLCYLWGSICLIPVIERFVAKCWLAAEVQTISVSQTNRILTCFIDSWAEENKHGQTGCTIIWVSVLTLLQCPFRCIRFAFKVKRVEKHPKRSGNNAELRIQAPSRQNKLIEKQIAIWYDMRKCTMNHQN